MKLYWITNAETSVVLTSLYAAGERDALNRWLGQRGMEGEHIVQRGNQHPFVTGDHGSRYVAYEVAAMREP